MTRIAYLSLLLTLICSTAYTQSSSNNNTPAFNNHLGWDDSGNSTLWINQNNQNRMIFNAQTSWTGLDGESETNVSRITIPQIGSPAEIVPA